MGTTTRLDGEDTIGRESAILYEELLVLTSENIVGYRG